jgi:FixJ family two-component response regulator
VQPLRRLITNNPITITGGFRSGAPSPLVYILDDDEGVRTSLSWLVGSVGLRAITYGAAGEFLRSFNPDQPACLILDVRMPEIGGFEVQEFLHQTGAHIPVVFVSAHGDIPMTVRAMKNGAFDFIEKPYNSQQLLERIQEAVRVAAVRFDARQHRKALDQRLAHLSPREHEVLRLVVQGKTSKLIAAQLKITAKTVDIHRASIREKLCVSSLAELVSEMLTHHEPLP